ncbi:aldehyde dehydrogenase family protein [Parvularcula marina]|uniref:Aldehyde dehydrogenase family protein n=2 Tax=Parvularcula marina TaxID=2292771 RepID=A0A371RM18_9PROT|nr:aldehyde dehydrogenase family protein [Parvularcula marina]
MLIDGELVPSSSGKTFENINPYTEESIGVTADGTKEDFERAILAARRAFDETDWSTNHAFRAKCLRQLNEGLTRHLDEIRPLLVSEVGTAVWLTRDTLLDVPVARLRDFADMAESYPYEQELPELDFRGVVSKRYQRREPMGVVAAIIPWNGPWGSGLGKIGAALAAGNTCTLKPSPDAPWSATIVGRIIKEETDIPSGVMNVVTSSDNLMGEVLTTHPDVDFIGFTGSAPNGRRVAAAASGTLKRMLLELGGKSPYIVLPSADIQAEAAMAAKLICTNAGQGCVARSRLLLPRERYEEGVEAAAAAMAEITYGDPADPNNYMNPLVSKHHRDNVLSHIEAARKDGNRIVHGGGIPASQPKGYFVEPTLIADVKPDDHIAQNEVFGPVLAVIAYDDIDDAVRIANNSDYGLSASVSAATNEEAIAVAERLRTGTVSINGGVWMHMDVPFGGYKQSGIGRQFGIQGFETYLETKVFGIATGTASESLAWGDPGEKKAS